MEAGARISPGLRWMILGEWRAHPARAATAAIAIALGVALGYAVHLINASAFTAFTQAVRTVSGEADLQVRARTAAGFDERVFPVIARTPGVAEAGPGVELAAVADNGARMTLLGLDALRAAAAPALFAPPGEGGSAFDDGAAHLSSAALAASGRKVGDFIGRLDRVDVKLERGADERTVRARIEAGLPADAEVVSQADEARRSDSLSRAYRVNLQMLGLVALLTGAFLVYSAQSLSTARRRPQFALLRVLGARQRAIVGQVLAEGAAVGVVGAVAGLALGLGAAEAALRFLGGDLGGGYFGDQRPPLAASAGSALVFGGLGLAAALLGSFLPARAAARLQPAAELKGLGGEGGGGPARLWPSLLLLAAGAASAFAPAIGGVPVFGYIAIALLLAGGVAAMPWIARRLFTPLQRRPTGRPPFDLAVRRIWGAPSQAGGPLSSAGRWPGARSRGAGEARGAAGRTHDPVQADRVSEPCGRSPAARPDRCGHSEVRAAIRVSGCRGDPDAAPGRSRSLDLRAGLPNPAPARRTAPSPADRPRRLDRGLRRRGLARLFPPARRRRIGQSGL
jgi:putative ABC transport system permease protein